MCLHVQYMSVLGICMCVYMCMCTSVCVWCCMHPCVCTEARGFCHRSSIALWLILLRQHILPHPQIFQLGWQPASSRKSSFPSLPSAGTTVVGCHACLFTWVQQVLLFTESPSRHSCTCLELEHLLVLCQKENNTSKRNTGHLLSGWRQFLKVEFWDGESLRTNLIAFVQSFIWSI